MWNIVANLVFSDPSGAEEKPVMMDHTTNRKEAVLNANIMPIGDGHLDSNSQEEEEA